MLASLCKLAVTCCLPFERCVRWNDDWIDRQDALLWYNDLGRHATGEFSIAVVQANQLLEDQSQVESGSFGTFVGIYDGHGGPEASKFVNANLFSHFTKFASEQGGMCTEVLRKAFCATEEGFESIVVKSWSSKPQIAAVGSCCLVGVLCDGILYVANLGDSRAVMGSALNATGAVVPLQLTSEHNASLEAVRQELRSLHPDDSHIVVLRHGVWRVKGIIQVSRSIGDVYLKNAEFNREPLYARFRLSEPFKHPILTAEPSIFVHKVQPHDKFVIFASDGLWEHLSNEEAVEIVYNCPRLGIARRLIRAALQEAAKKREMRYTDLKKLDRGIRRHFHDDITVIVVFLDQDFAGEAGIVSSAKAVNSYSAH
eukprot:c26931_g1_i1 orf=640-1749(-)